MTVSALQRYLWVALVSVLLEGCSSSQSRKQSVSPKATGDICAVIQENPHWYYHAEKASRQWGTPTPVVMAIIQKESGFRHDARPVKSLGKKKNGRQKVQYLSSAYGYAQALNGTWDHYQKSTGRHRARRDDFSDCVQFIGWYNDQSHKKCRIKKNDAYNLYLAYHEGHGGFNQKVHRKKKAILSYAKKVEAQARLFESQLPKCRVGCMKKLAKNKSMPGMPEMGKKRTTLAQGKGEPQMKGNTKGRSLTQLAQLKPAKKSVSQGKQAVNALPVPKQPVKTHTRPKGVPAGIISTATNRKLPRPVTQAQIPKAKTKQWVQTSKQRAPVAKGGMGNRAGAGKKLRAGSSPLVLPKKIIAHKQSAVPMKRNDNKAQHRRFAHKNRTSTAK